MNFLELVQALQEESGSGSATISTIVGVTGETLRLRNWISRANHTIQTRYADWRFLYAEASTIVTGIGTADYALPSTLNLLNKRSFKRDGVTLDDVYEYKVEDFPTASTGTPHDVYLLQGGNIRLWPTPDAAYTITYDYWTTPVALDATDNTDVSIIPAQFHPTIVYLALSYYANYEDAKEIKVQAQEGLLEWMPRLEAHQLSGHQEGSVADNNEIVIIAE